MLDGVRKYCKNNNLVYVFGIKVCEIVYFCVANTFKMDYTMYKMENKEVSVYLDNLSLMQTRFQKETLLGMGGELIEKLWD
mgnify:CR=1 FL=1